MRGREGRERERERERERSGEGKEGPWDPVAPLPCAWAPLALLMMIGASLHCSPARRATCAPSGASPIVFGGASPRHGGRCALRQDGRHEPPACFVT
jgi:hypothetical protein